MIETVVCICGCGSRFPQLDQWGRPRRFVVGHNRKRFPAVKANQRAAPVRVEIPEGKADRLTALLSRRGFSRSERPIGRSLGRFRAVRLYPGRVSIEWNEPEAAPKARPCAAPKDRKAKPLSKRDRRGRPPGTRALAPLPPKFKAGERVRLTEGPFAGRTGFVLEVPTANPQAHRRGKLPYRIQLDGRPRPVPAAEGWLEEA